jgi:hypothetical protein
MSLGAGRRTSSTRSPACEGLGAAVGVVLCGRCRSVRFLTDGGIQPAKQSSKNSLGQESAFLN